MKIILGSQSKNRKKVLEEMGVDFEVLTADIDEKAIRLDDPRELVLAIARAKADALKSKIIEPAILITADGVVVWRGKIREKPENETEAREFLEGYNTHPAETVTAVVVTNIQTGKQVEGVGITKVHFKHFSKVKIQALILNGQVFHLAGGFNVIGDEWTDHIEKIEGTIDSAIGLPRELTRRLIQEVSV